MDSTVSFLNKDEVIEHIRSLTEEISGYLDIVDPQTFEVEDFVDNIAVLNALTKTLEFTTVRSTFIELLKSI